MSKKKKEFIEPHNDGSDDCGGGSGSCCGGSIGGCRGSCSNDGAQNDGDDPSDAALLQQQE
jgi:hypothetical protein